MRAETTDSIWIAIQEAFRKSSPMFAVLGDDGEDLLPKLKNACAADGTQWLDSGDPTAQAARVRPFGLWLALADAHPRGTLLAQRLRAGPPTNDPHFPLLADPGSAYDAIWRWVSALAQRPLVVVLREVDRAAEDCLRALAFLARGLQNKPVALLMIDSGCQSSHWDRIAHEVDEDVGLYYVNGAPASTIEPREEFPNRSSLVLGIEFSRLGATHEGIHMLALASTESDEMATPSDQRTMALLYLAMSMLRREDFAVAASVSRQVLASADPSSVSRLARRILMLALHRQHEANELQALGTAVVGELRGEHLSPGEASWLTLDAALGFSLENSLEVHNQFLENILARPFMETPLQCRAGAHIWRAASYFLEGELESAAAHQHSGLTLLDSSGEFSRPMIVRSRLADVLLALGRTAEAAGLYEQTARQAVRSGDFSLAALMRSQIVTARVAIGDFSVAEQALASETRLDQRVWRDPEARLLNSRARATLALARGELGVAELIASAMLSDLDALPEKHHRHWLIYLNCEAAYLFADIAKARGETIRAKDLVGTGMNLAERASLEQRPGLLAAGRRRLEI